MRNITYLLMFIASLGFSQTEMQSFGGEFKLNPNNEPCLTEAGKAKINIEVQKNLIQLKKQGKISAHKNLTRPSFIWPIQKSNTNTYHNSWAVSNFLDNNSAFPDQLQDYNCGTKTYDTENGYNHRGIDIFTWPFSWYQFQNDLTNVIAAAPGTIIFRRDGKFDMNCSFGSDTWNAVYIEHSDGSVAWYGHLKSGSLTNKQVGDTIAEGEYLGVVGSSGSSTGPHLHFEVYDSNNLLVDPFTGNCNSNPTWWKNQPAYYTPKLNAVLIHDNPPVFNTCPQTETTNIKNEFLPNKPVYLASYFKDQLTGTTANYELEYPNGSKQNWSKTFDDTFNGSYWYWSFSSLSSLGTYTFRVTYQEEVVSNTFELVTTLNLETESISKFSIATNPVKEFVTINTPKNIDFNNYKIAIYNNLGQEVFKRNTFTNTTNLDFLSNGLYILKVYSKANNSFKSFKIIKE